MRNWKQETADEKREARRTGNGEHETGNTVVLLGHRMNCSEHTRACLDGTQSFLLTLVIHAARCFADNSVTLITEGIKKKDLLTASPLVAAENVASVDHGKPTVEAQPSKMATSTKSCDT
jgi:hypothetical protein